MTNNQLLILATVLVLIYLYWKVQSQPKLNSPTETIYGDNFVWTRETIFEVESELPTEQKDWFTPEHWLTDQEIDWALAQVINELPKDQQGNYKVLESTQFMFAKESLELKDPEARDSFPVLLSELTGFTGELVFIPVNNPNFHWSCLVYEVKEKKFYHFDTLRGVNDSYAKPLIAELLKFLLESWQDPKYHYETRYHLKQGNTWDCGIAVIEIMKAIAKDYPTYQRILMYTKLDFDFPSARQDWRKLLENHA